MKETFENTLERNNIKPTAMRLLVLESLNKQQNAVSITDIEADFEKVDRITLYRTLKTFEEHKLIHSIDDGTGVPKYALCEEGCECKPKDLHLHFHCNQCKRTYCLTELHIPEIKLPRKFVADEINLVVSGLCDRCSA
jgi:Fur family ferric uptake transcriptional regulator